MIRRSHVTCSFLFGFLVGIAGSPVITTVEKLYWYGPAIVIGLALIWRKTAIPFLISIGLLGTVLGIARYAAVVNSTVENQIASLNEKGKVTCSGVIAEEPDVRLDNTKLTVECHSVFHGNEWRSASGKVLISIGKYPEFFYGDRVEVTGTLEQPGTFEGFSYDKYLELYGIYSVMYQGEVVKTGQSNEGWVRKTLIRVKHSTEQAINHTLPEPEASFASGLLLGSRRGIPQNVQDDLQATGLTHIIAISGFNITLIILVVGNLLKGLRGNMQVLLSILFIVLFTILVGASAAVVRASIMGILGLIAIQFGRTTQSIVSILLTAALMAAWNPFVLTRDIGFQLSFGSLVGVIYVSPYLQLLLKRLPALFGVRDSLVMTLSAQVVSTPIILKQFHRVSMVAPLANILVAPAVPLAMFGAAIAAIVPNFSFLLTLAAFIAWLPMTYILEVAHWCSLVPYASLGSVEWGSIHSLGWYSGVFMACFLARKKCKEAIFFPQ